MKDSGVITTSSTREHYQNYDVRIYGGKRNDRTIIVTIAEDLSYENHQK